MPLHFGRLRDALNGQIMEILQLGLMI